MTRRARGRDLLECAKEHLSKAKTVEELRQGQPGHRVLKSSVVSHKSSGNSGSYASLP
jgi:hypothetical protein